MDLANFLIIFDHSMNLFNTLQWLKACFKLLMCIKYSYLSCKFANIFNFIFSDKKGKSYVNRSRIFWVLDINFKEISFITFFIITFNKAFIKFRNTFNSFKSHLQATFVTFPNYISYLHPNI